MTTAPESTLPAKQGFSGLQVTLIVLLAIVITVGVSYWLLSRYLFLREFTPVVLKPQEELVLDNKLRTLGFDIQAQDPEQPLRPEPYSEVGASREVQFSERELNAMLAKNTDMAHRLAIDMSEDLLSALLLIPFDKGFPVLGGKTLRVHAGAEVAFSDGRPVVRLKGASLMGVPIPNAWLGNLKNVDLVQEFGANEGFWKTFADGVETIQVDEGQLHISLKE